MIWIVKARMFIMSRVAAPLKIAWRGLTGKPMIVVHPGGRVVLDNCEVFGGVDMGMFYEGSSFSQSSFYGGGVRSGKP